MVVHMVSVGEITGKLDELFNKIADIYEEEVDDAVNVMTSLIQPALIVVIGVIVAFLLIAMYLPIFQLAGAVSGV
jgi:type IV pilus assembly protein PilC